MERRPIRRERREGLVGVRESLMGEREGQVGERKDLMEGREGLVREKKS